MKFNNFNGILLIDKNKDCTSRDIVNKAIKIFNTKKIGHTGTLDPLATGVLVLCIGNATKLVDILTSTEKRYIAEFTLGTLTDTLDNTGNILKEEKTNISKEKIEEALVKLTGEYIQETPIYSAVKVNGKKLYEYARNNEYVELPKRLVNIKEFKLLDYKLENNKTIIKVETLVSKGTYIRALASDLAKSLDTIGIMSSLRRIKQGNFDIKDCLKINEVTTDTKLINMIDVLDDYKKVIIDDKFYNNIKDGQIINNTFDSKKIAFIYQNNLKALYHVYEKDENKIKPYKMF